MRMADVSLLIESAFARLAVRPGFVERPDQRQLAMLIADCIGDSKTGAFEAPTGLGKSLAALIPAIAHAIVSRKRTIIATYTNVLAEQYWRNDLPLALSLFESDHPKTQFLIGRQRYACQAAMHDSPVGGFRDFRLKAQLGIETEFRDMVNKPSRELTNLWQQVSAPPVCPARLCSHYNDCFYYSARKGAEKAHIVITNHSVVLQDALLKRASLEELSMLGDYDFLILDEAHDFPQAAVNSLEFELSEAKLGLLSGIALRMQSAVGALSIDAAQPHIWHGHCDEFRERIGKVQIQLKTHGEEIGSGILKATPAELSQHPQVKARTTSQGLVSAEVIAAEVAHLTLGFLSKAEKMVDSWQESGAISGQQSTDARESMRNYSMYLREFAFGCQSLFSENAPEGDDVGVTYTSGGVEREAILRHDVIGLNDPLKELLWSKVPYLCLSATLATDGNFDFFRRMTGIEPDFEEILPSPFDYPSQASIYIPKIGAVKDPTLARKTGTEPEYYQQLARQLEKIIKAVDGRTLALFHSRKEMEGVYQYIGLTSDYPIYLQRWGGIAATGEKFLKDVRSSLFALRSFWTGFDAPGETLSCVVLVRVPFEVPIDPPAVARMAWLQTQGLEPFAAYSLPQAKMLMRQGAGRLIRRAEDRGVIALLDSRLRTKNYGEEILANMPQGMRVYDDIEEAVASAMPHLAPLV